MIATDAVASKIGLFVASSPDVVSRLSWLRVVAHEKIGDDDRSVATGHQFATTEAQPASTSLPRSGGHPTTGSCISRGARAAMTTSRAKPDGATSSTGPTHTWLPARTPGRPTASGWTRR